MANDVCCGFRFKKIVTIFPQSGIIFNVASIAYYVFGFVGIEGGLLNWTIDDFNSYEEYKTNETLTLISITFCAVGILVYISLLIGFKKDNIKLLLPSLIILPILFVISASLIVVRGVKIGFDNLYILVWGSVRAVIYEFVTWLVVLTYRQKLKDEESVSNHDHTMPRIHY